MKILQIPYWYPPEGGEFCRDQAVLLKEAGIDIDILANVPAPWKKYGFKIFTKLDIRPSFTKEDNLEVLRNYFLRIPKLEKKNIKRWINKTLKLVDLYIEEKGKPDIIHAHVALWAGYVAYLVKKKYGIPYVITEHHSIFSNKSEFARKSFKDWHIDYLRKSFSNADYILPVSTVIIDKINEFSNNNPNIDVISNMLDNRLFTYKKREFHRDSFVFFTANSYCLDKAYDVLLEAFEIVCKQKRNVELRIAGSGFGNPVIKQSLAKNTHSRNKINFCGLISHTEVRDELWNADAFVLASRAESQSIATLEALCTGLPVVCTEVVPEEVAIPITGYRVPVDNPHSLADAMLAMTENYRKFDSLAISRHAHKITDPDLFIKKTKTVYASVWDSACF